MENKSSSYEAHQSPVGPKIFCVELACVAAWTSLNTLVCWPTVLKYKLAIVLLIFGHHVYANVECLNPGVLSVISMHA